MRILCQHRQEQTKHEVMMMYNVRVAAGKQNICKKKITMQKAVGVNKVCTIGRGGALEFV